MGIGLSSLRFLLSARPLGCDGKLICTLGRQSAIISKRRLATLLKEYGISGFDYPDKAHYCAEDYLTPLGFSVEALDASDYEGADLIHDLNQPLPDRLRGRYDIVWDGGTLEHVFNFPVAIQNAMAMLKIGGHIFLETPANNQCGHGFYQFSPELFFRLFTPANGFDLVRLYITCEGKTYHVADPAAVHGRVELLNSQGTMLKVHARKLSDAPLSSIQQSDYIDNWNDARIEKVDGPLKAKLRRLLSDEQIKQASKVLNRLRMRRVVFNWKLNSRLSNRKLYVPVTDWSQRTSDVFSGRR